ncbi:DUF6190 family protein [Streptomyces sp. NPDC050504]|uniref:DUF6190 family protein n=1 Tax=Streptomyces sp. NPDC050504 TaxID=3365618 RepID=UPI0037968A76
MSTDRTNETTQTVTAETEVPDTVTTDAATTETVTTETVTTDEATAEAPKYSTFIDFTMFMGMHSENEEIRKAAKAFFAERLGNTSVVLSWEQVGRCDDYVWGFSREIQDAYYPFMDVLHTDMDIVRFGYTQADVDRAFTAPELIGLPAYERLLLAQTLNHGGTLHTASPRLKDRTDLPVVPLTAPDGEASFPEELERLYHESLVLSVAPDEL